MADARQQPALGFAGSLGLQRCLAQLFLDPLEGVDVHMGAGQHARRAGVRIMLEHAPATEQPVVSAHAVGEAVLGLVALLQPLAHPLDLRQRLGQVVRVDALTELAVAELPGR